MSHVRRLPQRASQAEAHGAHPFCRLMAYLNGSSTGKNHHGFGEANVEDWVCHGAQTLFSVGHSRVDADHGPGGSSSSSLTARPVID